MTRKTLLALYGCGLLIGASATAMADQKVTYSELPKSVQRAIEREKGEGMIQEVQRTTLNGREVYKAEIKRTGSNAYLWVGTDGKVLRDTHDNASVVSRDKDASVKSQVRVDTDRNRDKELKSEVKINTDKDRKVETAARIDTDSSRKRVDIDNRASVNVDNDTYSYNQLPKKVQNAVRKYGDIGTIRDVKKETLEGAATYQVEYAKDGRNRIIHFNERGHVLKDNKDTALYQATQTDRQAGVEVKTNKRSVDTDLNVGAPAVSAETKVDVNSDTKVETKKKRSLWPFAKRELTFSELPVAVQRTVKDQGETDEITTIHKESRKGRTVYEVEFRRDGVDKEIKIGEDGSVVADNNK